MLNPRVLELSDYPFDRLRALLDPISPPAGISPLALSIGEPKHTPPALIGETIKASDGLWDRYPPIDGTPEFRAAVANWLTRRFFWRAALLIRTNKSCLSWAPVRRSTLPP